MGPTNAQKLGYKSIEIVRPKNKNKNTIKKETKLYRVI